MTIQFYCPNCKALIAFNSKHIGKRARCLTCGQIFIIPSKDYDAAKKIERPTVIEKGEPVPGFYRAIFLDSWKIFFDPENITSLVFVAAVICFKFFLARVVCCYYISYVVIWGWLLGFYLNIIYETAFELDQLPKIYLGTSITFLWYIVKPFFVFFFTMAVMLLPFAIALAYFQNTGFNCRDIWQLEFGPLLVLQVLFILGLFFFPMAILTITVAKELAFLRPGYLFAPIIKALGPYLVTVFWLIAAGMLEMWVRQYGHVTFAANAGRLALNLATQVLAIIAMRSIGLFYRHYRCYLLW